MNSTIPPETSFAFLDYHDPDRPSDEHPPLMVKLDAFWSYCGPLLAIDGGGDGGSDLLPANLREWASSALSRSPAPELVPFLAFANAFVAKSGLDHYWLTIRATKATEEYNLSRWHTDDLFFSAGADSEQPDGAPGSSSAGLSWRRQQQQQQQQQQHDEPRQLDLETDWKICASILGPATRFVPATRQGEAREAQRAAKQRARAGNEDHTCASVRCAGCADAGRAVRESLASGLEPLGSVAAGPGQCSFFRIGPDAGAVHSEPRMDGGDRIFVNIVPGRRAELQRLMARWGMDEFPRAWWISPRGHEVVSNSSSAAPPTAARAPAHKQSEARQRAVFGL